MVMHQVDLVTTAYYNDCITPIQKGQSVLCGRVCVCTHTQVYQKRTARLGVWALELSPDSQEQKKKKKREYQIFRYDIPVRN